MPLAVTIVNDDLGGATQSRTALVRAGGATLVAAFTDSGSVLAGQHLTGIARSTDGGATWTDLGTLPGNNDFGFPSMAVDTTSGRIYLATHTVGPFPNSQLHVFRSDDGGQTWTLPVVGTPGQAYHSSWPTIAVDNAPGPGRGNVYLVSVESTTLGHPGGYLDVTRSTDGGATFGPSGGVSLPANALNPAVTVGLDHALYVLAGDVFNGLQVRKSTDFGTSFSAPVTLAAVGSAPQVAVHPGSGHLYVAFEGGTDAVYLTRSTDGGATWSVPVALNDDGTTRHKGTPTIAITPNGTRLLVSWYDRRNDPNDVLDEYYGAIVDISGGGMIVGANFVISDVSFREADWSQTDGVFQNALFWTVRDDRNQAVADDSHFSVTWTRTLTPSVGYPNSDVAFSKIPVAGPGTILAHTNSSPATFAPDSITDVVFTLQNKGSAVAAGITATMSTSTPGAVVEQATSAYPDLPPGASGVATTPFRVRLPCQTGCPPWVDLLLTVNMAAGSTYQFAQRIDLVQRVAIADAVMTEGSTGSPTFMSFGVSLSGPTATEARVRVTTQSGTAAPLTFTSAGPIAIPDGAASPYPVTIPVSGAPGAGTKVSVRLNGLTHPSPRDLDFLLVTPDGKALLFLSDVGGATGVAGITPTFDVGGAPAPAVLTSGVYAPANVTGLNEYDNFPAPAPAGPYQTTLTPSGGFTTNGNWTLYIADDTSGNTGSLGSVSLMFEGDYTFTTSEIVFPAGSSRQNAAVPIKGDLVVEPNETFTVALSNPVNLVIHDGQAVGSILNDDGPGLPTAAADSLGGPPGTLSIQAPGILANDSPNGGGVLSAAIVTPPNAGTLVLAPDGSLTYTSPTSIQTSFTYLAYNSAGASAPATVTLIMAPVPISVDDTYSTPSGTTLVVPGPGILKNDTLSLATGIVATSAPAHGTLTAFSATAGSFTYVPNAGFSGLDSFTYRLTSQTGPGNVATVRIQVTSGPGGGVPATVADAYTLPNAGALSIAAPGVLANDNANGGGTLTAALVSSPARGSLTLNANGSFTYTPGTSFNGADSFTYRAVNAVGPGNVATVTVTGAPPSGVQAPQNLRVDSVVGNTVTLRWDIAPTGAAPTGFVLEGGVRPGDVLASVPTGSVSPVFTFTAPSGSFFVRMHAQNGGQKSAASNEVSVHVNVAVAPSAPRALLGLASGNALTLVWTPTFGGAAPTGQVLDVTGAATVSVPIGAVDRFSYPGVPGGTYTFRVRQTNAGGSSPPSNAVTLTFPGGCPGGVPAQAAQNFLAYTMGRTLYLTWDPPATGPAPTSYVLGVAGAFAGSIPTTIRQLSGAVGPGTYSFRVETVSPCGGAQTAWQTVTVQ